MNIPPICVEFQWFFIIYKNYRYSSHLHLLGNTTLPATEIFRV